MKRETTQMVLYLLLSTLSLASSIPCKGGERCIDPIPCTFLLFSDRNDTIGGLNNISLEVTPSEQCDIPDLPTACIVGYELTSVVDCRRSDGLGLNLQISQLTSPPFSVEYENVISCLSDTIRRERRRCIRRGEELSIDITFFETLGCRRWIGALQFRIDPNLACVGRR